MLKKPGTIILVCALLMQSFYTPFLVADYYINTTAYKKNCINKAKAWLHCNGKCQLMKKLRQEEKKNEENPERKSENKNEIILSTKSFFATVPVHHLIQTKSKQLLPASDGKSMDRSFAIFHPPQA
jgi:hypothetical protein